MASDKIGSFPGDFGHHEVSDFYPHFKQWLVEAIKKETPFRITGGAKKAEQGCVIERTGEFSYSVSVSERYYSESQEEFDEIEELDDCSEEEEIYLTSSRTVNILDDEKYENVETPEQVVEMIQSLIRELLKEAREDA